MELKLLYQTLENRDNPDEVESKGPFFCAKNPWLGNGFYFWDTFMELAHWWGEKGYAGNYFICKCYCDSCQEDVFDLVGNTIHIQNFRDCSKLLQNAYPDKKITVPFVLEFMKKKGIFPYKAIRANPIGCTNGDEYLRSQRLRFVNSNIAYLDMIPPIQLCVVKKEFVRKGSFKIVYPATYCKDFTI